MSSAQTDAQRVRIMLGNFKYEESEAWQLILEKLNRTLNHTELIKLSELFTSHFGLKTNRYEKRNKELIVKFFQTHIDKFREFIDGIAYEDKNHTIGGPRANDLIQAYQNQKPIY